MTSDHSPPNFAKLPTFVRVRLGRAVVVGMVLASIVYRAASAVAQNNVIEYVKIVCKYVVLIGAQRRCASSASQPVVATQRRRASCASQPVATGQKAFCPVAWRATPLSRGEMDGEALVF